jgi:hypothetical protein
MRATTLTVLILACACRSVPAPGRANADADSVAARAITPAQLERHTRELSSARYEGRAPGTRAETLTVGYIERELRRLGLRPGVGDTSYRQRFDLYTQRTAAARGRFMLPGGALDLAGGTDFAAQVMRVVPRVSIDSTPIVFVGRGIVAPELGWDDYKDVDVRGKLVAFRVGGPPQAAGVSYYGGPVYKRQLALARGAAGVLEIDLGAARYARTSERLAVNGAWQLGEEDAPPLAVTLSPGTSRVFLAAMGLDSASAITRTAQRDFRPITVGAASFDVTPEWRRVPTQNVVARLDGADPARRGEYVVFTAHWDAWGVGPRGGIGRVAAGADSLNFGAADNAAGTAGLLATAEALARLRPRPARSVVFIATSSEERGYSGSRHYVKHPLYPLARTVAAVNLDLYGAPVGVARDVVIWGEGRSTLDDVIHEVVRAQGRRVSPDHVPTEGIYLRMDHLPFAASGVPAVSLSPGLDLAGKPAGWARERLDDWVRNRYHGPGDTVTNDWSWDGLALDVRTSMLVGLRLARGDAWPEWNATAEFRERRRRSLEGAR